MTSNDSNSSSEDESENLEKIKLLKCSIEDDPYLYDKHISLIHACSEAGELDELRAARENMYKVFPLSEDIWLSWLRDERKFQEGSSEEDRSRITRLFENAVKDYLSVNVWLEYIQFCISGLDLPDGMDTVREVCERAITNAGLHVTLGNGLWEAYREFEMVILARLMPGNSNDVTERSDACDSQYERIVTLFKRQLSIPLTDLSDTLNEYKEWIGQEVDPVTMQRYQKAVNKLSTIQSFEDRLVSEENDTDHGHLQAYIEYLDAEMKCGEPPRVQCLFERAIASNCLQPDIWKKYTHYLVEKLKNKDMVLNIYERSVRNCPWSNDLWCGYLLSLERYNSTCDKILSVFQSALSSGVTSPADALKLWTVHCEYQKRQLTESENVTDDFRKTIDLAINSLWEAYGKEGDPMCTLQRYLAFVEASHFKDMEKARLLWQDVMATGLANDFNMWIECFYLERLFGNKKHCRKILQRALKSVRDWPEPIVQLYVTFEKQEGTLEQLEEAEKLCSARMDVITQHRQQEAEKEKKEESQLTRKSSTKKASISTEFKQPLPIKRKFNKDNFSKVDLPILEHTAGDDVNQSQPTKKARISHDNAAKNVAEDSMESSVVGVSDGDDDSCNRTVFVSNLPYSIDEEQLSSLFNQCGPLNDVRLVRNAKGLSKGYAYVEFASSDSCAKALVMDRRDIQGRPMYVSAFKKKAQSAKFKYSTDLEKNKLFVSNLPFSCTKECLENIFSQHGQVTSVRLVTYKSGAPKGLAYVEYADDETASKAILKTDGLLIGEHHIKVALSQPPTRKPPVKERESFVPSLGGGKRDDSARKAKSQLSLMPRSLTTTVNKPQSNLNKTSSTETSDQRDKVQTGQSMSNSDFRSLLLKK